MNQPPFHVKMMADYSAPAFWNNDPDDPHRFAPVEYEDLPLCPETVERLESWIEWYERIDYPYVFTVEGWTDAEKEAFDHAGITLWLEVRREIGAAFELVYWSETLGRTIDHPDELEKLSWLDTGERASPRP